MAERGVPRDGWVIEHPNRETSASKATKAIVVGLLLVTAALLVIVTIGGWDALQGGKAVQIAYIVVFAVCAGFIARWNRGLLPVVAALSMILLVFAAVSAPGWFDRDKAGFTNPALDEDLIGLLTLVLIPLQLLLIAFAMRGFAQAWNVEVERPVDDGRRRAPEPQPA